MEKAWKKPSQSGRVFAFVKKLKIYLHISKNMLNNNCTTIIKEGVDTDAEIYSGEQDCVILFIFRNEV